MSETLISNSSDLLIHLSTASDGDIVLLAPGNYGSIELKDLDFSEYVTIRSLDPKDPAVFDDLDITSSSHIRLDSIHVSSPSNGGQGSELLGINGSHFIEVVNSEINGLIDSEVPITGYFGIHADGESSNVRIEGNYIHDVKNGTAMFGVEDLELVSNTFEFIGEDTMKFASVTNALIENNTGPQYICAKVDAHEDFMQFQGSGSTNVVIRGNVFLPQNVHDIQGIHIKGSSDSSNFLIEQNIFYTQMANGVNAETFADGLIIRDNTFLNSGTGSNGVTTIRNAPADSIIQNNITTSWDTGWYGDGNISVQVTDSNGEWYVGNHFSNPLNAEQITVHDIVPLPGSPLEGKGAYERLIELLFDLPR